MRLQVTVAFLFVLLTVNASSQVSEPTLIEISTIPSAPQENSPYQIVIIAAFANCCQPLYGYDVEEKDSTCVLNIYYDGRGTVMGAFGETLDTISISNLKTGTSRVIAHSYSVFGLNNTTDTSGITAGDTIYISTTGIDEYSLGDVVKIFPNPTKQMIHIEAEENIHFTSLTLMDNHGKELRKYKKEERKLEIANLPSGIYFLKLQTEKGEVTEKVVVK